MTIRVLMFAGAREAVNAEFVDVEISPGGTFADLGMALTTAYPQLAQLIPASRFAADAAYVAAQDPLDRSAEIALIPPVSGG